MNFPECFFVTGTDTGVGKTVICALLAAGLDASYWKPVQSGSEEGLDSDLVAFWAGLATERIMPGTYTLRDPLSPHLAAERMGIRIDPGSMHIPVTKGPLIIEGAGGIMVPLNDETLLIDWVKSLSLPVLVVAPNRLGVINHALLTISVLRLYRLEIMGIILNGRPCIDHVQAIEHFGRAPVLAQVRPMSDMNPAQLKSKFREYFE
ncbi:dethiobiotin synthase [Desulfonatronospira sp.]|uniref:dethiobiotin synthase n=1 Tax=Desulfonatronospira sp. TaxID=1962951 RepID=UPI0025C0503F|nr:dethiobiotin synthase [Desulfonatronospira sp.]